MNEENEKQFIPYLLLEEYYKKKYLADIKSMDLFLNYISSYFAAKKDKIKYNSNYNYICFEIPRETVIDYYKIVVYDNGRIESNICIYEYGRCVKQEEILN